MSTPVAHRTLKGRSLKGWRGAAHPLTLTEEDLELVDLVLTIHPELRVVLDIGQRLRAHRLGYPVESVDTLVTLLGKQQLRLGPHRIDAESVISAMAPEWFPIAHEGELLSMIHLALVRCQHDGALAALSTSRPPEL